MSPAVFKTDTTAAQAVGWVRFPDAPATRARSRAAGTAPRARAAWILVAVAASLLVSSELRAQERDVPPAPTDSLPAPTDSLPTPTDSLPTPADSLPARADSLPAPADSLPARADSLPARPDSLREAGGGGQPPRERGPVSPTGAMLRSIIVPGWGQTAARQPARGAIYFTVWTGGVYMILKTNADVNAAERGEDADLIDSRKQARENWILFTGLWALVSGVDAWVSAQFAGFEGAVRPPQDGSPGVEFSVPVKLF